MPIRHNAELTISYDADETPFNIFLRAYGHPDEVRKLCKLTMRNRRRQIMLDPEDFVLNIIALAVRRTKVNITKRDRFYHFTYHIDLLPGEPTVDIISHKASARPHSQSFNLFAWLGPDYRISKVTASKSRASSHKITLHKRRGRPTILSELQEPLPDRYK